MSDCCEGTPTRLDLATRFLGEAWHPGGSVLSSALAFKMQASRGDLFLDVGCGLGSTPRMLSAQFGCDVVGMDLSSTNAVAALRRSEEHGGLAFVAGDGQHVPMAEQKFDGVMLECVLSTFRDKAGATGEIARILKPGGRVGISDVVVEGDIPDELKSPLLEALCVARALPAEGYRALLEQSGFDVTGVERRKQETLDLLDRIKRALFVAKLLVGVGKLRLDAQDLDYASRLLFLARKSVEEDKLGYVILTAAKGR
ncbi:MAG: methyltransferase domain-containing protein [Thaumarchaeota archaeon]|nr:methyltransferase domain-containing protein [Nitrososphaerota archaeon]